MEKLYSCQASAAFGLEGLVSRELKQSGIQDVRTDNGCVRFSATAEELYLCDIRGVKEHRQIHSAKRLLHHF